MAGGSGEDEPAFAVKGLRLALPKGYLFEDLDPHVASSFAAAIDRLSAAGADISDITLAEIEALRPSNNTKSIVAAEAYHLHQSNLEAGKGERLFGAMTRLSCQHHRHCHQPYHRLAIFRPRPRKMPNAFAIRPSLTILTGQQSPFPAIRQALALLVFRLSDHASMTAGYWRLPPQASRSSAAKSHPRLDRIKGRFMPISAGAGKSARHCQAERAVLRQEQALPVSPPK